METIGLRPVAFSFAVTLSVIFGPISDAPYAQERQVLTPLRLPSRSIPYEPDRIIRTPIYEYDRSGGKHEITGRLTMFEIPMKYIAYYSVYYNETPLTFDLQNTWDENAVGTERISSSRNSNNVQPRGVTGSNQVLTSIGTFLSSSLKYFSDRFLQAKRSGARLDGYRPGSLGPMYWMRETYCGFDMFESSGHRRWHRMAESMTASAPPEVKHPFDTARYFGLPDEDGGYRFAVSCRVQDDKGNALCLTDTKLNDYVIVHFQFDGALLCDAQDIVDTHVEFLKRHAQEGGD